MRVGRLALLDEELRFPQEEHDSKEKSAVDALHPHNPKMCGEIARRTKRDPPLSEQLKGEVRRGCREGQFEAVCRRMNEVVETAETAKGQRH